MAVLVKNSDIPKEHLTVRTGGLTVPALEPGDEVKVRVLAVNSKSYRGTMLSPKEASAKRRRSADSPDILEIDALDAEELAQRHGRTDRRALLASHGFAVVDPVQMAKLQEVYGHATRRAAGRGGAGPRVASETRAAGSAS